MDVVRTVKASRPEAQDPPAKAISQTKPAEPRANHHQIKNPVRLLKNSRHANSSKSTRSAQPVSKPDRSGEQNHKTLNPKTSILDLKNPPKSPPAHTTPPAKPLRWHGVGFAAKTSVLTAAAMGVLTAVGLVFRAETDIVLYASLSVGVLLVMIMMLTEAAAIYGKSRILDGRPSDRQRWWLAARASYLGMVDLNLMFVLTVFVLGVAGYGAWQLGMSLSAGQEWIKMAAVIAVNSVLVWTWLSAIMLRRLAIPGVVLGSLTASEALANSLKWYRQHRLGMLIAGLETGLGQLLGLVLLIGLGLVCYALAAGPLAQWSIAVYSLGVALGVFLAMVIQLELEVEPWVGRYRAYSSQLPPPEQIQLLSKRIRIPKPISL
jgi:hypothetical protein